MVAASGKLFFAEALLPEGWREAVLMTVEDGLIASVESGAAPPADAQRHAGVALPGIGNVHSHGFQRGMAGLAERGGPRDDHFWTWREVMYRFLARLGPEEVEALTALAYVEMLESGFTAVGEFHYLHNDVSGAPYAEPAELSLRIAAAAAATGIGLALLPVFYAHGDFGGAPPSPGQRRFVTDLDGFARLHEAGRRAIEGLPGATLGVAPHSLRAVTPDELDALLQIGAGGPFHIHAAEQELEVRASEAALGLRPVEWLLDRAGVDPRWCLVHATHLTEAETAGLAATGAIAGLCPVTEANLGDGIFPGVDYLGAGGRFGIGTDSNIAISAAQELRGLEYSQRLRDRARNRLAPEKISTGRRIFDGAAAGGAQALGRKAGALAPGLLADIVVLNPDHPALFARDGDRLLDSWIFASGAGPQPVDTVYVAGRKLVSGGRHLARDTVEAGWRKVAQRLAAES